MLEWYDWWRVGNIALLTWALVLLLRRFAQHRREWNVKTRDYWFALCTWCVVGIFFAMESIAFDYPMGSRVILSFLAAVITLKGVCSHTAWGANED